jgi:hypothetical protein
VLSAPFSNCYAEYCYDKYNKSTTLRIKTLDREYYYSECHYSFCMSLDCLLHLPNGRLIAVTLSVVAFFV